MPLPTGGTQASALRGSALPLPTGSGGAPLPLGANPAPLPAVDHVITLPPDKKIFFIKENLDLLTFHNIISRAEPARKLPS